MIARSKARTNALLGFGERPNGCGLEGPMATG